MKKILISFIFVGFALSTFMGLAQVSVTNLPSTVTPQSLLHIHDNNASGQIFQLTNNTSGYASPAYGFVIQLDPAFKTVFRNQSDNPGAGISFQTKTGGTLVERFTILNNGNVGIGHINPGYKLAIGGQFGLLETGASPTFFTAFQSADLSANRLFTFPSDYGVYGQALTTDGLGNLSWTSKDAPLTFSNGLARSSNDIKWGGFLTENTTITQSAAQALTFTNAGTGNLTFNLTNTGDFDIQHAGTSSFYVNNSGRVGIGTNTPLYPAEFVANTGDQSNAPVLKVENYSTSTIGQNIVGIWTEVNSPSTSGNPGIAIQAYSAATTGAGIGAWGETSGTTGRGVFGWADHSSGVNYGVYGMTSSPNGYAGYFQGGKNYFQGKVGIGNINPDEELVVGNNIGSGWSLPAMTVSGPSGGAIEVGTATYSISMESGTVWNHARIVSNGSGGFAQGDVEFAVGHIGIGTGAPTAKLHTVATGSLKAGYFTSSGTGLLYPTLLSENTSTGAGVSGYFTSAGTDATFVLGQEATATGPLFKAFGANGGEDEFRIESDGTTKLYNGSHVLTIMLDPAEFGTAEGGQITMFNGVGETSIAIDGDYNNTGYGRISTGELEITGGADLAEPFGVMDTENVKPGMVLSIDPENPGKLKISAKEYDHCVAGIRSGASNVKPGLILRQRGTEADGDQLVALSGRVYCLVDASYGAIEPGDLLTTSSTPGYARKVTDHAKAQGAIIGKAMSGLASDKGLVLVLVTLQ